MIPVKTPVTPVTFSSSHYLIQHVLHICSTSSPEGCEQLHIIHWNKEHGTPCASHPSSLSYNVSLKNRLLLVRSKQKEEKVKNRHIWWGLGLEQMRKMNVIDRHVQIFGLNHTTAIHLSVVQVDSSGKILDVRKINTYFYYVSHNIQQRLDASKMASLSNRI